MDVTRTLHKQTPLLECPVFKALKARRRHLEHFSIAHAMEQDPSRATSWQIQHEGLLFNYASHRLDASSLSLLIQLAEKRKVPEAIEALFSGKVVNHTENKAALHMAYRGEHKAGQTISAQVAFELNQLKAFEATTDFSGITDCIHIGIGGSDLGPQLLYDTFSTQLKPRVRLHTLSSPDEMTLSTLMQNVPLETTVVIIASKSFTSAETSLNAHRLRHIFEQANGFDPKRWYAVTGNRRAAEQWGILRENCFNIPDWLGGRYSLWGSIGLSCVLNFGYEAFEDFLKGGASMDRHFTEAPLHKNIPVIMALLNVWYRNFWSRQSHAILPYLTCLKTFVPYCQQLEMESLGKSFEHKTHTALNYETGAAIWGGVGPDFQHAFGQALHQGTFWASVDFILSGQSDPTLVANALSQAQVLRTGIQCEHAYQSLPGNRPSSIVMLKSMRPFHLGQLIALWEHKVFVQSILWGINAFDQCGVQWSKQLAKALLAPAPDAPLNTDGLTQELYNSIKAL